MGIQVKDEQVAKLIAELERSFPKLDFQSFKEKVDQALEVKKMKENQIENMLILTAVERIDRNEPDWTYAAARLYLKKLYMLSSDFRGEAGYGSFYELINSLIEIGIYDSKVLTSYSREEIDYLEKVIDPERDKLFTYIGLLTMQKDISHVHKMAILPNCHRSGS